MGRCRRTGRCGSSTRRGSSSARGRSITAAGLLLSTADISDPDFLHGRYHFDIPGMPGRADRQLRDAGGDRRQRRRSSSGGSAVLAAETVKNRGVIEAELGTVVLGGSEDLRGGFRGRPAAELRDHGRGGAGGAGGEGAGGQRGDAGGGGRHGAADGAGGQGRSRQRHQHQRDRRGDQRCERRRQDRAVGGRAAGPR